MKLTPSNLIWGIIFIILGVGFGGEAMGLWDFNIFFSGWWALIIVILSVVSIIQNGPKTGNIIWLAIGGMLFLGQQDIVDFDVIGKLIVPVIFVLIGISIIFRNSFHLKRDQFKNVKFQGGMNQHSAIFAGNEYHVHGEKFMGTNMNAIFGGVELDLREAIIEEDIVINATVAFGGIDITVPGNVNVKVSNIPIFGGVSNKAGRTYNESLPTIYVNSTCMFGGIDIK
ncbi:LiaF transmembrane domain-containing protein [Anaerocolumna xylanovorans]|uniref:Cell wall-active antibiotics response 4TMS YvqF n=1 Tax=Anaerocolumna xylanovorans DSM 12503 TaxID=1121345 RepID=A0A1M7Y605_9FIRM|nr:LiaF domain-containing protein [Anaerocolumna xylanovorans]SHO47815.1 Cell wall-active antibiotics response 4TMS YvqF [Anaerocolumna xylanovorans DSM 12503]